MSDDFTFEVALELVRNLRVDFDRVNAELARVTQERDEASRNIKDKQKKPRKRKKVKRARTRGL